MRLQPLRSILSVVQSSAALRSITVHITYEPHPEGGGYFVDRAGFLDELFSEDMVEILSSFADLRLFHLTLRENDPQCDNKWWNAQVVGRVPNRLHSIASAEVWLEMEGM